MTRIDMRNNTLTKFHRMWFAHRDRLVPFANKESRIKTNGNPESIQPRHALSGLCNRSALRHARY
jgi:hypothetical protein